MQNTRTVFLGAIRGTGLATAAFSLMIWLEICWYNNLSPFSSDGAALLVNVLVFIGVLATIAIVLAGIPLTLLLRREEAGRNSAEVSRSFASATVTFFYLAGTGATLRNYGIHFDDYPVTLSYWSARVVFAGRLVLWLLLAYLIYKVYVKTAGRLFQRLRNTGHNRLARSLVPGLHTVAYTVVVQMIVLALHGVAFGAWPLQGIGDFLVGHGTPRENSVAIPLSEQELSLPNKVLLLGLDGVGWRAIDRLAAEGKLPTFRYLKGNGSWGYLCTYRPTLSPLLWTTIATGASPERHGIKGLTQFHYPGVNCLLFLPQARGVGSCFNFLGGRLGLIRSAPVLSTPRKVKAIWEIVDACGGTNAVFGWWPSRPADPVAGYMVSDYGVRSIAHNLAAGTSKLQFDARDFTPPEFGEAISMLGVLRNLSTADRDEKLVRLERRPEDFAEALDCLSQNSRITMALGMFAFKQHSPHFTAVYVRDTDNHHHWEYMEPEYFGNLDMTDPRAKIVRNIYIALDRAIEEFVRNMDEKTTLVIVSDHSIRPVLWEYMPAMTGSHTNAPAGIIIMYGNGVKSGYTIEGASVYDVAPTVLALLGIPVPDDIEGAPLTRALTQEFKNRFPIRHVASHGGREVQDLTFPESAVDEEFIEQLKALGYIE